MHRALTLSAFSALALCAAGAAFAQSRTVSTADVPKPGVSYISGPAVPVRRETVSTGSLPQPPHLYVGDRTTVVDDGYDRDRDASYNDGYGGYYGGSYGGSYGNGYGHDDRDDRDRDRNHGRPDHGSHGNGGRPPNTANTVMLPARGSGSSNATGAGVTLAPDRSRQNDRRDRGNRGNGWNRGNPSWNRGHDDLPPVQPGTGTTNSRAPQPGTGMGSGNQPGTGIPMRGGGWNNGR
jgi:hypothetical protein